MRHWLPLVNSVLIAGGFFVWAITYRRLRQRTVVIRWVHPMVDPRRMIQVSGGDREIVERVSALVARGASLMDLHLPDLDVVYTDPSASPPGQGHTVSHGGQGDQQGGASPVPPP